MPLVLMVTGQLQSSGQSLVFFTPKGSEALMGKQMILPMQYLLLSRNPSLSFKTAGLRNENGGWPLIIFRRQDLKVNHTQCNIQYIQYIKMTEKGNKTVSLMLNWKYKGNLTSQCVKDIVNWFDKCSFFPVFFPDLKKKIKLFYEVPITYEFVRCESYEKVSGCSNWRGETVYKQCWNERERERDGLRTCMRNWRESWRLGEGWEKAGRRPGEGWALIIELICAVACAAVNALCAQLLFLFHF